MWLETEQAKHENRHELVLSGLSISERINHNGLDSHIFNLEGLNFLEISKTSLSHIDDNLGKLVNLQNLVLRNNRIDCLPGSIGKLQKLKFLDLSSNELKELPDEIGVLTELQRLNVSVNKLTDFPDISKLDNVHVLDVSHNSLTSLPDGLCSTESLGVTEVYASNNELLELPTDFAKLLLLKVLDLTDNKLQNIPSEMGECPKLREFKFGGNKLKDRRLGKMMDQCTTKSVLDYLKNILEKERQKGGKGKGGKKNKKKATDSVAEEVEEVMGNFMKILHFRSEEGLAIRVTENVTGVRPYIVCCVVRHLDFHKSNNMFKRFIALQTKLHDTVCQKRQVATIATHDLASIKAPLTYDAKPPAEIKLVPLFKQKEVTAQQLVVKLWKEAEELRREKKRSTISGIHKYLDLLKGKPLYPCLLNSDGVVVSFPPITNCEVTKISADTQDLLIEVTSSVSLDVCKKVLDSTLNDMLELGVGCTAPSPPGAAAEAASTNQCLVVEQVQILNPQGSMKVVYPARTDIATNSFQVIRDYE